MTQYVPIVLLLSMLLACSIPEEEVYLFSFFRDNGEDGLHLAYSINGLEWTALNNNESFLTPMVGSDKLMRDPCIIIGGDGKYHMVWTVSWNEKGIGYANSVDLINWSDQQYIPVMHHEPETRNCWAPELYYDSIKEDYIIYWASTIPERYPNTEAAGDNGYNHRMYYTTTKDFVAFTKAKILYDDGFNVIDATIMKDGDQYIMFLKDETLLPTPEKNIRIATSTELTKNYTSASESISPHWVEGPTVLQKDSTWIVYFDLYKKHRMGAISSVDLKNWADISDSVKFPLGTRHGTVFKVKESVMERLLEVSKY